MQEFFYHQGLFDDIKPSRSEVFFKGDGETCEIINPWREHLAGNLRKPELLSGDEAPSATDDLKSPSLLAHNGRMDDPDEINGTQEVLGTTGVGETKGLIFKVYAF
jgi:hypothetical protein